MHILDYPIGDICRVVKKTRDVVSPLLNGEWAAAQLQRFQDRFEEKATTQLVDPISKFTSKLDEKIEQLDALTKSEDPKVALAAIRDWINHAIGTPLRRTEIDVNHSLNQRSPEELMFVRQYGRFPTPPELRAFTVESPLRLPPPGAVEAVYEEVAA